MAENWAVPLGRRQAAARRETDPRLVATRASRRLALAVGVAVVAFALAANYLATQTLASARTSAAAGTRFQAALAAKAISDGLASDRSTVAAVTSSLPIAGILAAPDKCQLLYSGPEVFPAGHIDILTPDGRVACSSLGTPAATQAAAPWLAAVRSTSGVLVSAPFVDPSTGQTAIAVAEAVHAKGGRVVAVLAVIVTMPAVAGALAATYGGPDQLTFAVSDGHALLSGSRTAGPPTRIYGSATVAGHGWQVQAGISEEDALGPARATLDMQVRLGVAVLLGTIAVLIFVNRRITRPLVQLVRTQEQLRSAEERLRLGAVERAQLFESQASVAQALQRALLPAELPRRTDVRAAARYLTAHGDAIGGDWYDLINLPNGAVAVVMGDVEGHSPAAAAIMGQARNVLRAYAAEGHTPAEVMNGLSEFVTAHTDVLITCCYAELDPPGRTVASVSAGHPMPVVVDAGGTAYRLAGAVGPPLGVESRGHYSEHTTVLPAASRLLMFTDGLVDGDRAAHPELADFLRLVSGLATECLDTLADAVVSRPEKAPALMDDAAFLVVELTGPVLDEGGHVAASRTFQPVPAAVPTSRHFVQDVLEAWHLQDLQDIAGLVISELVTNAVLHTAGPVRLTVRRVDEHQVWFGVRDDSDRLPQLNEADDDDISGRGLAIIDLVSDGWGVTLDDRGGKTVWLQLSRQVDAALAAMV